MNQELDTDKKTDAAIFDVLQLSKKIIII